MKPSNILINGLLLACLAAALLPSARAQGPVPNSNSPFDEWAVRLPKSGHVLFGDGKFLLADSYRFVGGIYSSTDGQNWAKHYTNFYGLRPAYGNGRFVTFQTGGLISTNGTAWEYVPGVSFSGGISALTFGNGKFFGVGPKHTFMSEDGVAWEITATNEFPMATIDFANSQFIAGGPPVISWEPGAEPEKKVAISTDGREWVSYTMAPGVPSAAQQWTYGNGRYVGAASGIYTFTTPTEIEYLTNGPAAVSIVFTDKFIAVGK